MGGREFLLDVLLDKSIASAMYLLIEILILAASSRESPSLCSRTKIDGSQRHKLLDDLPR